MNTLKLRYTDFITGSFEIKPINVLFIFQLSSPKSLLEAVPVCNDMYTQYKKEVGFVGLSTAIENYEINTKENTIDWIVNKSVWGPVAEILKENGKVEYPNKINFPVAYDQLVTMDTVTDMDVEDMMKLNKNYENWSESDKISIRVQIKKYLMNQQHIAYTFTYNQFLDTPGFILFNDNYEILEQWYTHKNRFEVKEILEKYL